MSALRDLLTTPETQAPQAPQDAPRHDMAGATVHPDARQIDMTGAPFPSPGDPRPARVSPAEATVSTRGFGGWYVILLVTVVLIGAALNTAIRNRNHDAGAATSKPVAPAASTAS